MNATKHREEGGRAEGNGKRVVLCVLAASLLLASGCKSKPNDDSLAAAVRAKLSSDSALTGQSIQPTVQQGVVTLYGTVGTDAQRTIAARDVAGISGVQRVIDSLQTSAAQASTNGGGSGGGGLIAETQPDQTSLSTTPIGTIGGPEPANPSKPSQPAKPTPNQPNGGQRQTASTAPPAPIVRGNPQTNYNPGSNPSPYSAAATPPPQPPQPPPPPPPTFRTLTLSSGSVIPVRVTQTLDSASTQPGTTFSGVVASDVMVDGLVAIPAGSSVSGLVNTVQDAAHFKGASSLSVTLNSVTRRGEHLAVTTEPYTVTGKGRGANTAEKVGGGAGVQAATRGQQVQIASESIVSFHLANPVSVRVRTDGDERRENTDSGLQHHTP
jgi:hypothetical protein